jgi:membrane protease YdiL (CAAX protease family)
VLATYGNVLAVLMWEASDASGPDDAVRLTADVALLAAVAGPLALLCGVLAWHLRVDRGTLADLGLHQGQWRAALAWGAAAGIALAAPPVLALLLPLPGGLSLQLAEVSGIGRPVLLLRVLVTTPVLVALVEEVTFRGFLQGKLERALPGRPRVALVLGSLSFALWHIVVNQRTVGATNVAEMGLVPPLAVAGGLVGVFIAGLVFGGVYQKTRSLVAPVLAHWLTDAALLLALH